MEALYGIRTTLKEAYRKNANIMNIMYRAIVLFMCLLSINNTVGIVSILKNPLITVILAACLSLLPMVFSTAIIGVIGVVHILKISMLVAVICAVMFCLMGILILRLAPGHNCIGLGSFAISSLGGTFAAPLILSMTAGPMAVIPMVCGLLAHRVLVLIKGLKSEWMEASITDGAVEFLQVLVSDKILILTLVLCSVSYLVATGFKNLSITESWKIGLLMSAIVNVVGTFLGKVLLSTNVSILTVIIMTALGFTLGLIIEVFIHNVEYRATEILNFEDDEYFYYVKAVPKKESDKSSKTANVKSQYKATERKNTRISRSNNNSSTRKTKTTSASGKNSRRDASHRSSDRNTKANINKR